MKYLDRDLAFLLELDNEKMVVSKDGKPINSSDLNSVYLQSTGEQTSSEKIYWIYLEKVYKIDLLKIMNMKK